MVTETGSNSLLGPSVAKEKEELLSALPQIDIDRIRLLKEVYNENEGKPPVIKRAKLFDGLCAEKPIHIDQSPIVGSLTQYKYGGYPLPESGCRWMSRADRFRLPLGYAPITPEQRELIDDTVAYWKDANIFNRTRELLLMSSGVDIALVHKCGVGTELTPGSPMQTNPDYAQVLNTGFTAMIAAIKNAQAELDIGNAEDFGKWHWYEAASLCLKAMIKLAQRYSVLAEEMAGSETNPARKRSLEKIAEICKWIPANPARSFREAIQAVWFTILGVWMENPMGGNGCPLRFSQYMYPFFKADKEQGMITDEEAIELIQFFMLKLQGLAHVLPPFAFKFSQSRLALHLSLGGLTPDGGDATNELDWLVLEAKKRLMIPEPLVLVLYHDNLSEEFLLKCVDLMRTGIGQPAFYDARKMVGRNLHHRRGITLEQARNNAIIPCVQDLVPGYTDTFWEGNPNMTKALEFALNNGKDPLTGIQLGPQTGEANSFENYDELHAAVIAQIRYIVPLMRTISRTAWNVARDFPVPFGSALTHDCIEKGMDMAEGGARYPLANGTSFVGVIDLANSLAAIKKLVFEKNSFGLNQLKEALAADFEGFDYIQRLCMDAPKYGNSDEYVDSIARELYKVCWDEHQKFPDYLGRPIMPHAYSAAAHGALGELTGALPNGRKSRLALTDASVSAQPGTDKEGPTALVTSAAKVLDTVKYGSNHFNIKFHPSALEGSENARKFLSLVKTYMDMGGYHVQLNCVSADTLKDAKAHPEDYKDLIVRVAGFSAYFVHLDPLIQDEIIKRTEIRFV